jgi:hypothetical protein
MHMKQLALFPFAVVLALALAGVAQGAAPDGAGPWADFVVSAQQGTAGPLGFLPGRSDPQNAVGPAESPPGPDQNPPPNSFFSLGFGGTITLGFVNPICNKNGYDFDIGVVETTIEPYPPEIVNVYVSDNGTMFAFAGQIAKDGSVAMPAGVDVAHYVKLVDVSDPSLFTADPHADGFDVDGVKAFDTTSCKKDDHDKCGGGDIPPSPPNHQNLCMPRRAR